MWEDIEKMYGGQIAEVRRCLLSVYRDLFCVFCVLCVVRVGLRGWLTCLGYDDPETHPIHQRPKRRLGNPREREKYRAS